MVIRDPLCLRPRPRYTPDLSSQGGPCPLSGWAPLMRLGRETWETEKASWRRREWGLGLKERQGSALPSLGPHPESIFLSSGPPAHILGPQVVEPGCAPQPRFHVGA